VFVTAIRAFAKEAGVDAQDKPAHNEVIRYDPIMI
jgi:hypothetical protein